MEYKDEQILKLREEEKRQQFSTLQTGIYLGGNILKFREEIFMDAFSVSLPETMKILPEEYAKVKYPSEFRPQILLSTPELEVNLGFTLFPDIPSTEELKTMGEGVMQGIKRAHPDCILYPAKYIQEGKGYYFSFRSHALDEDIYNMSLLMQLENGLLQGSFNCLYRQHSEWKKVVVMIWETIEEWKEEEECEQ